MHDYVKGAFEALSWARSLVKDSRSRPDGWDKVLKEIEAALDDIKEGVATDFKWHIKAY